MARPNEYNLGGNVDILSTPTDLQDVFFVPQESRLSIKEPSGTIITVSGADITVASGYMVYEYKPPTVGWYQYEWWHREDTKEVVKTLGFEVTDKVY